MPLTNKKAGKIKSNLVKNIESKVESISLEKVLSKISLPSNFEQLERAPLFHRSMSSRKKENKKKVEESTGKMWFNMPKAELDEAQQRDLQLLRARSGIDLSRFYRKVLAKDSSKYIQVGTVIDTPENFYSNLPNREKPKSFVEQILEDNELRSRIRKRHKAIVHTRSQAKKYWKRGKKKSNNK